MPFPCSLFCACTLHPSNCLPFLAAQKSHRKIAATTVAASRLAAIPLQKSQGFSLRQPQKKSLAASDFWVTLKIAGSSQRPWPQVAAAARFCGRSDHGTLSCPCVRGIFGKIQRGAHKRGLKPRIFRENRGKSFLENRAFAISGLVGAFSGPIGTNSSAPHSHRGRAEIAPKGPFLARLAPFGLSPPLLSPRLDFPEIFVAE